mmetsp:Transcript_51462/g.62952  ORF Transcript_51462/g.62952 Transcript_51462/m.62952 type:complete len:255 (-) Transcript_51462:260-1024(-)
MRGLRVASPRRLLAFLCLPAARVALPSLPFAQWSTKWSSMETSAGASPMWEDMWSKGLKPKEKFDVGEASPTLVEVLARKSLGDCTGKRALVPGCGRAYDAIALAEYGFDSVVAVDLSATAAEAAKAFLAECKSPAAHKIEIVCADFFKLDLEPKADVIWDCTFLCALDPSVRPAWAKQTLSLLKPDGTLLTCIFPICDKEGGPPFAMSVPLVRSLLEPEGFQAAEIREDAAKHTAGGSALVASTALGRWTLKG